MKAVLTLIVCAGILAGAAWGTQRILATEPKAQREGATRKTPMLVELTTAPRGTFRPEITVLGRVRAERDVMLQPQVAGRIVHRADSFTPGGIVKEDEILFRIEAADFRNRVRQARSALEQAQSDLQVELGRQNVARRDYEMLAEERGRELDEAQKRLALREPQVEAARARVASARAAFRQARLDLRRTEVKAPFDAQVLRRDADFGSRVAVGEDLGRIVAIDTYWVVASVPLKHLRFIDLERKGDQGAVVRIRDRAAWPEGTHRTGHVMRLIGTLERETRLAQVLVAVDDPLARDEDAGDLPLLILDAIVEARIKARPFEDVVRLDRDHLRMGDRVWIMKDGKLDIRDVEVAFRDATHAYVSAGLEEDAQIVTTNLATVVQGAPLRTAGAGDAGAEAADGPPAQEAAE